MVDCLSFGRLFLFFVRLIRIGGFFCLWLWLAFGVCTFYL